MSPHVVSHPDRFIAVTATTTPDNQKMITVFRKMGFTFEHDWVIGIIRASKELDFPTGTNKVSTDVDLSETTGL